MPQSDSARLGYTGDVVLIWMLTHAVIGFTLIEPMSHTVQLTVYTTTTGALTATILFVGYQGALKYTDS